MKTSIVAAMDMAEQHFQQGRLDIAETVYRKVIEWEPKYAEPFHFLGLIASRRGDYTTAINCYRQAIALEANVPYFHINLGNILESCGKRVDAMACYQHAIRLDDSLFAPHLNLGNAFMDMGHSDNAIACYRHAIQRRPDSAEAYNYLGDAYVQKGAMSNAIGCYRHAIGLRPEYAQAYNNLGVALNSQGNRQQAIECWTRALELNPSFVDAMCNLGQAYKELGNCETAVAIFRRALELSPNVAELHNNLALALCKLGRPTEAVQCLRRACELSPQSVEMISNLGSALRDDGRFEDAINYYHSAIQLDPTFAEAHLNLGLVLKDQGKLDEAESSYNRALAIRPDYVEAKFGMSLVRLLQGDWLNAWPAYELRWKVSSQTAPSFDRPVWDGSRLDGKTVLLHSEQGLGDTIMFIRFAKMVKQQGATVIAKIPGALRKIFDKVSGVDRWLVDGDDLPDFDVHCPMMSLPGAFKTRIETIPNDVPYLAADHTLAQHWNHRMQAISGFKVGICWKGNPKFRDDRLRSTILSSFAPLFEIPRVQMISLQKGGTANPCGESQNLSIMDFGEEVDREAGAFMDTAAIIQNLDLVITVDTAIAHLAGALGAPVWNLLSNVPHWPWLLDRSDSPWYPTMRLFRRHDAWQPFMQDVAGALREHFVNSPTA
ncbi:MAG: tetratricopeptide repeat protein [Pirellula sp.]